MFSSVLTRAFGGACTRQPQWRVAGVLLAPADLGRAAALALAGAERGDLAPPAAGERSAARAMSAGDIGGLSRRPAAAAGRAPAGERACACAAGAAAGAGRRGERAGRSRATESATQAQRDAQRT